MLLQDVLKASSKCLEDVLKTSWQNLLNSSCKRTTKINIFVLKTSWRRLHQDERLLGMHYRRLFGLYSRKWKAAILNYSNYVSFSLQDWGMRMSMLAGLKVSSLTCKCVLYRPELNAKGGGVGGWGALNWILKVLTWNILKDGAQRVDGKNSVTCLVAMFTFRVMDFRISEVANFWIFYWWQ